MILNIDQIVSVRVVFSGSGSVAHLEYYLCPELDDIVVGGPNAVTCDAPIVEDYETDGQAESWTNWVESSSEGFTTFLGRLGKENNEVSKTFVVPQGSEKVTLEFDFYDIDGQYADDTVEIGVQESFFDLGVFSGQSGTQTYNDVTITNSELATDMIGFEVSKTDKVYRSTIDIPKRWYEAYNFEVRITIRVTTDMSVNDESYGVDNLSLTADCNGPARRILDATTKTATMEKFEAPVDEPSMNGDDGLFYCSASDFPCEGEGMVYICHFSAHRGYQTFCIPEADSEVLRFYSKDYCGPCVGGFGGVDLM